LYLMNTLVAAGFWMFWPTITALVQELTPGDEFVHANTFLLAGVQGGWLIAGAVVGFVYNKIGLGGVLLIDVSTYVVSFLCYFAVRKGRHVVPRPAELHADIVAAETAVQKFFREMREGLHFLRGHREIVMLGLSWALFLSVMNTSLMEQIPQHFMGRVQNTFYAAGTTLQVLQSYLVGTVAQWNLVAGFSVIGMVYAIGFISTTWPVHVARPIEATESK